jgi:predicted nucleotidyltransferase component of viral defense system
MIDRAELLQLAENLGLQPQVVEKDYALGWLLAGIRANAELGNHWVFKGGTCLKKCYFETYRFSEDLDSTVLPHGPYVPDDIVAHLHRTIAHVSDASGINLAASEPVLRLRPDGLSVERRAYSIGPRQQLQPARVKLDITANERVVRPPVLRDIGHPYPDALIGSSQVRCYSFEELFAEKQRAMAQRGRPRDVYDVVTYSVATIFASFPR